MNNRGVQEPLLSPDSTVDHDGSWNNDYYVYNNVPQGFNANPSPSFMNGLLGYLSPQISQPSPPQNSVIFDLQEEPVSFNVQYLHYPKQLFKNQKRNGGKSRQLIENGKMQFVLDFVSVEQRKNVAAIYVKVKRSRELDNNQEPVGEVPLIPELNYAQETKVIVKVELDSVYEYRGKLVYELERSLTDVFNIFHLIVEVHYNSGQVVTQNLDGFKLVGKKKKAGEKRPHSGSNASNSSEEIGNGCSISTGVGSPSSIGTNLSEEGIIQARQVVADHIKAKTLEIDGLHMGKTIETHKGDIAYNFPLKDKNQCFEEGEVVALVPDDENVNRNHVIEKLSMKNADMAALKGVITRSHYLEAMVPLTDVPTETICMLGIVPVQVVGSVACNEGLYASPNHPGCAISRHHLSLSEIKEAAFIGHAFSARKTDDEASIGFVQAGVSVLETAGKVLLDQKLRDVEESFDGKIGVIQKSRKRSRKVVMVCGCISLVLLVLTSIFLWQLLTPGSAYRYYICKMGRKTNPEGSAWYTLIPYSNIYDRPRVNGILFDFKKLMKKTHHTQYKRLNTTQFNITSVNYYLNIDRCAYGGLRETHDSVTGRKRVFGADVFAIDGKCFNAWYYDENREYGWRKYNSASWKKFKNIGCDPPSRWKSFHDGDRDKTAA